MGTKKILMIVGDFVEDYEVMVPFQALGMVGYVVDAVCPDKNRGDTVKTAIHDFEGDQTYTEKPGHLFTLNQNFADIKCEEYDALVIPGGRAPEYLRLNQEVLRIVTLFDRAKKPIAAVCHGIQILTAAGIVANVTCSAYPACEPEVIAAGGNYANLAFHEAIVDGHIITAPAWTAHSKWLAALLAALGTKIITA